jgi:hypothetical protein
VTLAEDGILSVTSTPNASAWAAWAVPRKGHYTKVSASIRVVQGPDRADNWVIGAGVFFGAEKLCRVALVARPNGWVAIYFQTDDERKGGPLCGSVQQPKLMGGNLHKYELVYSRGGLEANIDGRMAISCTPGESLAKESIEERTRAGLLVSAGGEKANLDSIQVQIRNVVVE